MKKFTIRQIVIKTIKAVVKHLRWLVWPNAERDELRRRIGRLIAERDELRQKVERLIADSTGPLFVVQPDGCDFRMLTDLTHAPYYERNNFEEYSANLVLQRCMDGGTFIDIGAHHGYYTLLVATQRKHCHVMAFEPVLYNYQILNDNLRINEAQNVVTFNFAISDHDETIPFKLRDISSHGSLYNDHISAVIDTVNVETVSLDNFLRSTPRAPIVIKIDTEGHEIQVLKGMINLLTKTKDVTLLLEFNPVILQRANHRPEDLLRIIASLGFNAYFVDDEQRQISKVEEYHFNEWESYLSHGNFQRGYCSVLCQR